MQSDELIPLPPEDPDGELSRRLGRGGDLRSSSSFERALAAYRESARSLVPSRAYSARLWQLVAPSRRQPFVLVPMWARWAAAAIVLIAFGLWFVLSSRPTVEASAGAEILSVSLTDGSSVTLRPRSTLWRLDHDAYRLDGGAFFDVSHKPDRIFTVESALGRVRVHGTRFAVSTWGAVTTVFLEAGQVSFEFLSSGSIDTLAPGEALSASARELSVSRAPDAGATHTAWMRGALVLGERPLSRIIAELEHHFGITVLVPDSVGNETLSGQIQLASPEQSLSDIGIALGARFEESRPHVFRYLAE